MNKKNLEEFLLKLTELTKKHGMVIAGCGHCGSPTISDIEEDEKNLKYTVVEISCDIFDECPEISVVENLELE